MKVVKSAGTVPRIANILALGVSPNKRDSFERAVALSLSHLHPDWECVVTFGESFDHVEEILRRRPELDILYMANEVGLSSDALRRGVTRSTYELAKLPAKPCVVFTPDLAWTGQFFHTRCIDIQHSSIKAAMKARYEKKCEAARAAA